MHLSDLKDTCTYVCNMHSLLMHTGYTAISTANLNLSTIKHTFARFSFLSPGEKNFAFTFLFDSYLITYRVPSPLVNYINSFHLRLKTFRPDHCRLLPNWAESFRIRTRRCHPILHEFFRFVPREFTLSMTCSSVSFRIVQH